MTDNVQHHANANLTTRWRRWRWRLVGLVGVAVVLFAAFILRGWGEVARQLDEIRARGEPVTMQELAAYYTYPPADQDATQLWLRGAKALKVESAAARKLPYVGTGGYPPLPGQSWPELPIARRLLQDNELALQDLHAAAALGGKARYPIILNSLSTFQSEIPRLRNALSFLSLEAIVLAYQDNMSGAGESIRTGLLFSQSLANLPDMSSQINRMAFHSTMIANLKRIGAINLPEPDLARLQQTLAGIDFPTGMKRGMIGDRAIGLWAFEDIGAVGPTNSELLGWFSRGIDKSAYLTITAEQIADCDRPWMVGLQPIDGTHNITPRFENPFTSISDLLSSNTQTYKQCVARAETLRRLAIVDIAIARYRHAHGRPPADLAALSPDFLVDIPRDPTTDAPFSYRSTGSSHVVYSPTKAFWDSLGDHPPDAETGTDPRLLFRWPPLPEPPPEMPKDASQETTQESS